MRKLKTMGLVFFVLFSLVRVGYSACEGDLNCDGDTDGADLALLAADFGTIGCGNCDDVMALIWELSNRISDLERDITQLESLLQHFRRDGNDIYIEGANLHILDGSYNTEGSVNGLGNLIVGYNESRVPDGGTDIRFGSHNIVVGKRLNYASYGGLVVGYDNTISAAWASVSGGVHNTASDYAASVSGGRNNKASGDYSSVSGGQNNTASTNYTSVSGGMNNSASGPWASVSGGGGPLESDGNIAFGHYSSILGGWRNIAGDPTFLSSYVGEQSVVSAGSSNVASGDRSAVSGGYDNIADEAGASVSGGRDNNASAVGASVSGGDATSVTNNFDWAAGDLYEAD
jgi:hypothetical protein